MCPVVEVGLLSVGMGAIKSFIIYNLMNDKNDLTYH